MQFKKSLTLITAASSIACMSTYADNSAITEQFIKYLNSTWYQTPENYQKQPEALQTMLKVAAAQNSHESTQNISDTIQLKLNFLDDEANRTYTQMMGMGKNQSWLGLMPDAKDPRSQSMIRMYCDDSKKEEHTICSEIINKGLPLNVAIGGDRLLYLLADRTTSSNFSIPTSTTIGQKITDANGQAYTPISNMAPNDNIINFHTIINDTENNLTASNYLAQYLSGAYMLNTALNPCFGTGVLMDQGKNQAQQSADSQSTDQKTDSTDPCSGGKQLVMDLFKLIQQDRNDTDGCQLDQSKCSLYKLTTSPAYFRYQLDLRSNIARSSLTLSNFYYIFKKHVKISEAVKLPKVIESDQLPPCAKPKEGGKVTGSGCSRAQLEQFIANYRLQGNSWLKRIKTASPALVMREQALINAESLQVLQHMETDLERILASTTLSAADQNYTLFSTMSGDIGSLDDKMKDLKAKAE